MKSILSITTLSLLFIACGSSQKGSKTSVKVADPSVYAQTITQDDLKTALYQYASDEFEGRETGAEGQKKAVNFLKEHYIKYGVPAAKADGNYFQDVPLELQSTPDVTLTINGKTLKNLEDFVSINPMETSQLQATEIVNLGYGIEDDNYSSYEGVDVTGKVVLFKHGEPKNEDGTYVISGTEETSKWSNFRQQFALKRDIAMDKGAKAVLFYHPEVFAMAALRYGTSSGRMSLVGNDKNMYYFLINDGAYNAIVKEELTTKNKVLAANFDLDFKNNSKALSSENVAAIVRGTEKPDEYIIISAHLDHEGVKNGEVYNGADDDGSGTVAVLEIAEAFAKAKQAGHGPKRSVVFLNVTGEEKGLLGSRHYTDNDPIFPLANTVANLNIDMIGRTDPKRKTGDRNYIYLIGSDKLSTELHNISEMVNTKYANVELDYTYNDENDPNRFYYRSDHYNFAKNNIPVIFYFNGTHDDYHRPSDTPDKIEYDLLENRARLVFYTAWELANRDARITVDKAQ
ncbi:M28 family peptidase [Olleya aquimaris]|uniref:Zn-dependent M28 family amino/carboxypeptidase n=1 Tax=Olleya aquimaris TaxID=639310 RepID=A0A327R4Z7_9FLAO|nr:M28 family peptidase [Olleya aquimaris]RAJ11896.1 Zn-dependent M28 family amino/carboxypeptidase [Olleya aquimaris]